MEQIIIESERPYISITTELDRETVEKLGGEFATKDGVSYGVFFINVNPTDELITKGIKLHEALALNIEGFDFFVIKGELLERLMDSTKTNKKEIKEIVWKRYGYLESDLKERRNILKKLKNFFLKL